MGTQGQPELHSEFVASLNNIHIARWNNRRLTNQSKKIVQKSNVKGYPFMNSTRNRSAVGKIDRLMKAKY